MFGARKQDITYFTGKTMDQTVDELLNYSAAMPWAPIKNYTSTAPAGDPDNNLNMGDVWVDTHTSNSDVQASRRHSFRLWYMGVIINQDRNIREKMTLFWHNHFATEANVVANARFVYKHHALLRSSALGNVKQLVKAITIDPAMLAYLNGHLNSKEAPDENYSRELQELFTLGKENNPNYTEEDVRAAAKVLTGWRYDYNTATSFFDPAAHDVSNKTFSSFYNATVITGRTGPDAGEQELDALLDMIFAKKEQVSTYLVKKLYRWYLFHNVTPQIEDDVIQPLAKLLVDSNWEIKPVMKAFLTSAHFYDANFIGSQLKSPLDFVVGFLRECNVRFPDNGNVVNLYEHWNDFRRQSELMLQQPGDPPDVSGWKAYYQKPFYYEFWINSDTYPRRLTFTDEMVDYGYMTAGKAVVMDRVAFLKTLNNPSDPNQLIDELVELWFRTPISKEAKDQIKRDILLEGQTSDYYWTEFWVAYLSNPNDMVLKNMMDTRLVGLFKYLMSLAEYQLM